MTTLDDDLSGLVSSTVQLRRMSHALSAQAHQLPEQVMGSHELAVLFREVLTEFGESMATMATRAEDLACAAEHYRLPAESGTGSESSDD